jgi:hypothetical protein
MEFGILFFARVNAFQVGFTTPMNLAVSRLLRQPPNQRIVKSPLTDFARMEFGTAINANVCAFRDGLLELTDHAVNKAPAPQLQSLPE